MYDRDFEQLCGVWGVLPWFVKLKIMMLAWPTYCKQVVGAWLAETWVGSAVAHAWAKKHGFLFARKDEIK